MYLTIASYSVAIQLHKIGSECWKLLFSLENLIILTDCRALLGKAPPANQVSPKVLSRSVVRWADGSSSIKQIPRATMFNKNNSNFLYFTFFSPEIKIYFTHFFVKKRHSESWIRNQIIVNAVSRAALNRNPHHLLVPTFGKLPGKEGEEIANLWWWEGCLLFHHQLKQDIHQSTTQIEIFSSSHEYPNPDQRNEKIEVEKIYFFLILSRNATDFFSEVRT